MDLNSLQDGLGWIKKPPSTELKESVEGGLDYVIWGSREELLLLPEWV